MELIYETHAPTVDNENGVATGWLPGALSDWGLRSARELGERWCGKGLSKIYSSDLARAVETARLAFGACEIRFQTDARLRECHYGRLDGGPAKEVHGSRLAHLDTPYPAGESWRQAVRRHADFLRELAERDRTGRVLVIGHAATLFAFQHLLEGMPLETALSQRVEWQPGWRFILPEPGSHQAAVADRKTQSS